MLYSIRTKFKVISFFLLIFFIIFFADKYAFTGENGIKKSEKHASIHFPVRSYSFGKVAGGKVASHNFVFYNNGDDILVIEKVSAG